MPRASKTRTSVVLALLLAVQLAAPRARAADCPTTADPSPCLDADALWMPAGRARFVAIGSAESLPSGAFGVATAATYLARPVVATTASTDPAGREVLLIERALDFSLLLAWGATDRLELDLAFPVGLRQSGAGVGGLTSQDAPPVSRAAVHDPRIGTSWALVLPSASRPWALKARLDVAMPLGDAADLAGDAGPVLAPAVVLDVSVGPCFGASGLGARARRSVELAGARMGSQLVAELGLGCDLVSQRRLALGLEAFVLPVLASQDHTSPDGTRYSDGVLAPAEWLASVSSAPLADDGLSFQLGAGSALPLSSQTRIAPDGTSTAEHFAGITSPALRVTLGVRYAPGAAKLKTRAP